MACWLFVLVLYPHAWESIAARHETILHGRKMGQDKWGPSRGKVMFPRRPGQLLLYISRLAYVPINLVHWRSELLALAEIEAFEKILITDFRRKFIFHRGPSLWQAAWGGDEYKVTIFIVRCLCSLRNSRIEMPRKAQNRSFACPMHHSPCSETSYDLSVLQSKPEQRLVLVF